MAAYVTEELVSTSLHSIPTVDFKKGSIKKTFPTRQSFELELNTTIAAQKVAAHHRLFYVPRIFSYDCSECWIKFEYISGLTPLHQFYLEKKRSGLREIMQDAGKVLAVIHASLDVGQCQVSLPSSIPGVGPCSFLHGDYNLRNVHIDTIKNRIVVIDWASTPLYASPGNWGSIYWDISWMLNSLFASPPNLSLDFFYRKTLADGFLKNYLHETDKPVDLEQLALYCRAVFRIFAQKAWRNHGIRSLAQMPNRLGLLLFARGLIQ